MGSGDAQESTVEIDWSQYRTYTDEWLDNWVEHDVKGCRANMQLIWNDLGSTIDEVKEHHAVCPLNN